MSTPSLTMFTATIHGSRESVKRVSFSADARVGVQDDDGRGARDPAQDLGDRLRVLAVRGDDEAARVAVPAGAQALQARVRLLEDPRQPVGQLDADRRPVAAPGLTAAEDVRERRLDDVVAAAPLELAVVRDERHRPADAVAHRVRVRVRDVRLGDAVGVVAHARDRGLVGAERRAREQQPAVARRAERGLEALAPRQLVARGGAPRRR